MIEIDGSHGEGGGQILRSALTLSAITQKPCCITNVRKNRNPPGLQPQHLMAALSLTKICRGKIEGADLKSQQISFYPGKTVAGDYFFDIGTAGSAILVLQKLLPVLIFADGSSTIKIIGGTHLPKSPNYDYFEQVFLPAIRRFGASVEVSLTRSGYYPRGGGEVVLCVNPSSLKGCEDWRKESKSYGIIRIGKLPSHIALREESVFKDAGIQEIKIYEEFTYSPGNALTLVQGFRGASELGVLGKKAEQVAASTLELFFKEKEEIDSHLADQLLIYGALAMGITSYRTSYFSDHFLTQIYILSKFLDKKIQFQNNNVVMY